MKSNNDTFRIAAIATLAALAAAFGLMRLAIPYPLMPFLKFDLAEIPDIVSFIIVGPSGGLVTALIHWFVLNLKGGGMAPVVGPLMKLMAISSMMLGLYIGAKMARGRDRKVMLASMIGWGIVTRVLIMGFTTFLLYYAIMPDTYIPFAEKMLKTIGVQVSGALQVAVYTVLLTAVFNAIHVPLSVLPAAAVAEAAMKHPKIAMQVNWLRSKD